MILTKDAARLGKPLGVAAVLAFAVAFPVLFSSPVSTNYGVFALLYVAVASAWNLFSGFSGYISLGHAVFFGSGAYVLGITARDWNVQGAAVFWLLALSTVTAVVIAVPFGLIALRVRRHTFIVVTIAVFFIFQLMAFNFWFTSGTSGISAPFLPWSPVRFNDTFFYITLACAVAAIATATVIRRSRFGLQLRAIKDDEDRARGLGVRALPVKLAAFTVSAAFTGLAGGVWFLYLAQVLPQSGFNPLFDLAIAFMAFLGGLGSITGPVLGALLIEPGTLYLNTLNSQVINSNLSEIVLGALFLVVVLFLPRGIVPTGTELLARVGKR